MRKTPTRVEHFQIQRIIWNRQTWRPGSGWGPYSGSNPHTDHLHVEVGRSASSFGNALPRCAGGSAGCSGDCELTTAFVKYLGGPKYLDMFDRIPVWCQNWGSSFCRHVAGSSSWSAHAYGTAVDLGVGQGNITRGNTVRDWLFSEMEASVMAAEDFIKGFAKRFNDLVATPADAGKMLNDPIGDGTQAQKDFRAGLRLADAVVASAKK